MGRTGVTVGRDNMGFGAGAAVDVWYVRSDRPLHPDEASTFRSLLPTEEAEREFRFLREEHQRQYLLTRVMVRKLLGHYGEVSPEKLEFRRNAHGKPEVSRPSHFPWQFNLSHTSGLVVCAVGHGAVPLGIDVEPMDRRVNLQLANRYFSPFETKSLELLPFEERPRRFLHYWTLKEAFIKALGTGLATPLDHFGFELHPQCPPRLHLFAENLGSPAPWRFAQFTVLDRYWGALARQANSDESEHGSRLPFRIREANLHHLDRFSK